MLVLSSALWFVLSQATAAPSNPPSAPVLQVGLFAYGPDGKPQAAAYQTSLATESLQYVSGCGIGSGNRPVPDGATDAWRSSVHVERTSDEETVVRVDWHRVRAAGRPVTSPGGSVQLTLHAGDRVLLDSATPDPTGACGARTIGFEARFDVRPGWTLPPPQGGGSATGRGSGAGFGSGAAAGAVRAPAGDTHESPEFSADVFLVKRDARRTPEDAEFNMQGLIIQKVRGTAPFAFAPFTIDTPVGPVSVQITGSLQVTTERGFKELVFSTVRKVQSAAQATARDSTSSSTGSSTTRNPMPGPDDVLSFELPPIRVADSASLPEQYSVRVRVR